jgi:hypothetical protein
MATRRSRPGDRARLSRDTIVAGTIELADAEGLDNAAADDRIQDTDQ